MRYIASAILIIVGVVLLWQSLSIGIYYTDGTYEDINEVIIGRSHSDIIYYYAEEYTDCPTNISVCETDEYDVFINCHEELEDGECQDRIRVGLSTPNGGLANYLKSKGMTVVKVGYISGAFNIWDDDQPHYRWGKDIDFKERFTHGGFAILGAIFSIAIIMLGIWSIFVERKVEGDGE
jgi:hypothetical protein